MIARFLRSGSTLVSCSLVALGLLFSGCSREPFPLVRVAGTVTYEDGEPIPADTLTIRFVPLADPRDSKTHPRPGTTLAGSDGTFNRVTTHKANDGIVRGRHKVLIRAAPNDDVVPRKYLRAEETPLEVDTADSPFHLKVERP